MTIKYEFKTVQCNFNDKLERYCSKFTDNSWQT